MEVVNISLALKASSGNRFVPIVYTLRDIYWGECLVCVRIVCTEGMY